MAGTAWEKGEQGKAAIMKEKIMSGVESK